MSGTFTNLRLDVLDTLPGWFSVVDDVWYFDNEFTYLVEAGFKTDLASIPAWLRPFFSRIGRSRKAAVFHDHMYGMQYETRKKCDQLFKKMLIECGVPNWKATLYYLGVRAGGWTRGSW